MNVMHGGGPSIPVLKSSGQKLGSVSVKQRKVNFSSREVETLLAMVRKYREAILMSVANGRGWLQAWQSVAKAVSSADGIERSESDCRKKWTYLKWEARHTSKPGRTPTSRAVLEILLNQEPSTPVENHFAPTRENLGPKSLIANPSSNGEIAQIADQILIPRDWGSMMQPQLQTSRKKLTGLQSQKKCPPPLPNSKSQILFQYINYFCLKLFTSDILIVIFFSIKIPRYF